MDLDQLEDALTGGDVTGADVLVATGVLIVGALGAFLIRRTIRWYFGRPGGQSEQIAKLVGRVIGWLVQVIAIAWALNILGFSLGWFTITVGFVLIVLVLAAKPLVESFASSAVLATRPAFGVGDDIEVDDHRGEVIEITNRSTVIRLRDGRRVHVPNVDMLSSTIIVYTVDHPRRSSLDVTIVLDADIDEAETVILGALAGCEAVVDDPLPNLRARELTEGVRLSVRFWHESDIRSGNLALDQAVRAIKRALEDAGIDLAVPQVELLQPPRR